MDGVQVTNPGLPARNMDQPHVLSSVDLLTHGRNQIGKTAVVVDDVGHYEALGIAEYLQENGAHVTLVTSRKALGTEIESALMVDPALERLDNGKFTLLTRHRLASVGDDDAVIGTTYEGGIEKTVDAETVVFISANKANRELYVELEEAGANVQVIGDANAPRFMQVAVREGHLAAKAI
jgi:pyruvate/2-oxoglutarate dehydrogenase complex dihydrolipoamide dehydrogenase (E3) component